MTEPKYTDPRYWVPEAMTWTNYDIRDEWIPTVDAALDEIFAYDSGAKLIQIKEKFGGLRLYIRSSDPLNYEWLSRIVTRTEQAVEEL